MADAMFIRDAYAEAIDLITLVVAERSEATLSHSILRH
jgi:hypothetical protein